MVFGDALLESVPFQARVQCDPFATVIAYYKVEERPMKEKDNEF